MRFASLLSVIAFCASAVLATACGERDVDLAGEGARRTGALPPRARTADEAKVVRIAAAADLSRPAAPTKSAPTAVPARAGGARPARPGGSRYEVDESALANAGRIEGVVKLSANPFIRTIPIDKDTAACGHESHPSERCVFDPETLGLANTVIVLEGISKGKDWPASMREKDRELLIDQKACRYIPHVLVGRSSTQIVVDNSDGALHNIHGYFETKLSTAFNFGTPANSKGARTPEAYLKQAGMYIVMCDVHPWMAAYVHLVPTPYFAISDAKGTFSIDGVPPGEYTLKAWHEGMNETPVITDNKVTGYTYSPDWVHTQKVTVAGGETATVELTAPAPTE